MKFKNAHFLTEPAQIQSRYNGVFYNLPYPLCILTTTFLFKSMACEGSLICNSLIAQEAVLVRGDLIALGGIQVSSKLVVKGDLFCAQSLSCLELLVDGQIEVKGSIYINDELLNSAGSKVTNSFGTIKALSIDSNMSLADLIKIL